MAPILWALGRGLAQHEVVSSVLKVFTAIGNVRHKIHVNLPLKERAVRAKRRIIRDDSITSIEVVEEQPTAPISFKDRPEFNQWYKPDNNFRFLTLEPRKPRPEPPFVRLPIYFPDVRLWIHNMTEDDKDHVKETGWLREVVFRTTPNVTKLEIKAILETCYGMEVERVHTLNVLGKKHMTLTRRKRLLWRDWDYKKAYVLFKRPSSLATRTSPEVVEKSEDSSTDAGQGDG